MFINHFLLAQKHLTEVQFNANNSPLPNNIYKVFQDSKKKIWFTTNIGVFKYDSKSFTHYNKENGLSDNEVFSISEDSKGRIWFLTYNGEFSYYLNGKIYNSNNDSTLKELKSSSYLASFFESKDGTLYFGNYRNSIFVLYPNNEVKEVKIPKNATGIVYICEYEDAIYFFSKNCLYKYTDGVVIPHKEDLKSRRIDRLDNQNFVIAEANSTRDSIQVSIYNIHENEKKIIGSINEYFSNNVFCDGNFAYVSCYFSSYKFDLKTYEKTKLQGKNRVSSLLRDHQNGLWISTLENGVYRQPNFNGELTKVKVNSSNRIIFGDQNIYEIDEFNNLFQFTNNERELVFTDSYINKDINAIISYDSILLLSKKIDFLVKKNDKKNIINRASRDFSYVNKKFYISANAGLYSIDSIFFINDRRGKVKKVIDGQLIDHKEYQNKIIFATTKGVYELFNGKTKKIYDSKVVKEIFIRNSDLLISSNGGELVIINLINYKQQKLLDKVSPNNLFLTKNNVFFSEKNQIFRFNLKSKKLKHLVDLHGFNEIQGLYFYEQSGILYILYHDELYSFKENENSFLSKPLLSIESISVNGEDRLNLWDTKLPYYENNIIIDFNAIDYSSPIKYHFFFDINNSHFEKENGQLFLNNLPPGTQFIHCAAVNDKGEISNIISSKITILPPWWKTIWFRIAIIIAIAAIIILFFKVNIFTYNKDVIRELILLLSSKLKQDKKIVIKNASNGALTSVSLNAILWIEGAKDYVNIYMKEKKILCRSTMKAIQEQIQEQSPHFIRIHKSYIANTKKVDGWHSDFLNINNSEIPIGRAYKKDVKSFRQKQLSKTNKN